MSLLTTIRNLSVEPRHEEDEYEYTSDFLEWFYYNIFKEKLDNYPIIRMIKSNPEHKCIYEECETLINVNNAKNYDNTYLRNKYENMKQWTIHNIQIM